MEAVNKCQHRKDHSYENSYFNHFFDWIANIARALDGPENNHYLAAVPLANGKLLLEEQVAQSTRGGATLRQTPQILKLNADGSQDFTYGKNGVATVPAQISISYNLFAQPDGSLLFYGSGDGIGDVLTKLTPDGLSDSSFGENGQLKLDDFYGETSYPPVALVMDSNGGLVASGFNQQGPYPSSYEFIIEKFTRDGKPDLTFGKSGVLHTGIRAPSTHGMPSLNTSPEILSSGDIRFTVYMCGGDLTFPAAVRQFLVYQIKSDGTPDINFGKNGTSQIILGGESKFTAIEYQEIRMITAQDGRSLLLLPVGPTSTGDGYSQDNSDISLARLDKNGSLDKSFGIGGIIPAPFSGMTTLQGLNYQMVKSIDGKILVLGTATNPKSPTPNPYHFIQVAKFDFDGNMDMSFGDSGIVKIDLSTGQTFENAQPEQIGVTPSGNIFVLGSYTPNMYGPIYNDFPFFTWISNNGKVIANLNSENP